MARSDDEEALLRSVALQNAESILLARRQAEEALGRKTEELARSLAMMRATLESTTDAILVTDGDRKVTGFNEQLVAMWEIPREILDAQPHDRLMEFTSRRFPDPERLIARIDEIYATSPSESYDLLELADGRVIERFSRTQIIDERNVGRVWSFRDITERERALEALRKQSEWLRVTLASIGDAVITTDGTGCVTSMNPVAEELTGWTRQDAIGTPLSDVFRILDEATRLPCENPAKRALPEGQVVGLANHTVLVARDGAERAIDDSAAPIRDDRGTVIGVVLIFRDITRRRRDEEKLRAGAEALKDADRRKDEFLALLAHELRNPLAPIRNSVHVLRAKNPAVPELKWATDVIDRQVSQMTRLIDDLLDVSRITRGTIQLQTERVDLVPVVVAAIETCRPLVEQAGHELTVSIPLEPIELDIDLTRMGQVLFNLLDNATKYTDRGGHIRLSAHREADRAVIRVRDNGIGIPADMLPKIFDMFTQVDRSLERSRGGLGAGLTLVQRLVELHGGTVRALSAGPGAGSEFIITLPIGGART